MQQRRREKRSGRGVLAHAGQEKEELQHEGHQRDAQEVGGGHHVEQSQGQHPRLHP